MSEKIPQLKEALVRLHEAGDMEKVNLVAAELHRETQRQNKIDSMSPIEKGLVTFGSGIHTTMSGIANLTGMGGGSHLTTLKNNFEKQATKDVIGDSLGLKALEIAGTALPGIGVGAVAAPALASYPILGAIALGGAEGAAIAKGEGGSGADVAIGAALGGATAGAFAKYGPALVNGVRRGVTKLLGRNTGYEIVNSAGEMTPEVVEALKKYDLKPEDVIEDALLDLKQAGQLAPEDAARYAQIKSSGIEPTKAQVSRDATDFQAQEEMAKTSGKFREALEHQQATLTTRFSDKVKDAGTISTDTVPLVDAVLKKATVLDNEIGDLYKSARSIAEESGKKVSFDNLNNFLKSSVSSNQASEGAIRSIAGKLKTMSLEDGGTTSVVNSEKIRQHINDLWDTTKPSGHIKNILLREAKEALDFDVFKSVDADLYKQARNAYSSFQGGLDTAGASKFSSRNKNIIRDVLEDKIDPDQYINKIMNSTAYRPSDVKTLMKYIAEESPEALNSFRADTLDFIMNKSFGGPIDAQGYQKISRASFERAINKIGMKKLETVLLPDQVKYIKNLRDTLKLLEPVRGTALGKGPSAQAISAATARLAGNQSMMLEMAKQAYGAFKVSSSGKLMLNPIQKNAVAPISLSEIQKSATRAINAPVSSAAVTQPLTSRDRNKR